jgi:hypothetical protein
MYVRFFKCYKYVQSWVVDQDYTMSIW